MRCLILACGNTLRGDDGVGPWLGEWAQSRFRADALVKVVSCPQWTPELAEEIAAAQAVVFIDCSIASAPGSVELAEVGPDARAQMPTTHDLDPRALLALSRELYGTGPVCALLLTVGGASTELGEQFSAAVDGALPGACGVLESAVLCLLGGMKLTGLPQRA
jgi:hydrogenase maturation protease